MFGSDATATWHFWPLVTRLGEAQVVVPLAVLAAAMHARMPQARPAARRWITLLAIAILVTTATKVAFIGWGIGSAALNFTGISGHTMFAAAVYPPLFAAIASGKPARRWAIAAACVLALLVGISRVALGTHSASEVMAGWLLGGLVSLGAIARGVPAAARLNVVMLAAAALWMTLLPATARPIDTHSLVTRLALALSGHPQPFTRRWLLERHG